MKDMLRVGRYTLPFWLNVVEVKRNDSSSGFFPAFMVLNGILFSVIEEQS